MFCWHNKRILLHEYQQNIFVDSTKLFSQCCFGVKNISLLGQIYRSDSFLSIKQIFFVWQNDLKILKDHFVWRHTWLNKNNIFKNQTNKFVVK